MQKKFISFILIITTIICMMPFLNIEQAYAKSSVLTSISYKTGTYLSLESLNIYTNANNKNRTGKKIPNNKTFKVSVTQGEYGKTTYDGKTGWVNLSYAYNPENSVNIKERLNMLRKKFPTGKYWNKVSPNANNPDGYTNKPCAKGHKDKRCAYFDGTCQCHGFAIKLGYDLFGIHPYNWERHYDISKVKVGDLIRYRGRHTVMITGVYDTYFTVTDCNWNYCCNIEWDRKMKKSYFSFIRSNKDDGIYHCPTNGGYIFKKVSLSASSSNLPTPNPSKKVSATTTATSIRKVVTSSRTTVTSSVTKKAAQASTRLGTGYIIASPVNVRKSASTSSQKLGTFKENDKVDVIEKTGDWYKISYNNDYAFVMTKFVNLSSVESKKTSTTNATTSKIITSTMKATVKTSSESKTQDTQKTTATTKKATQASTRLGTGYIIASPVNARKSASTSSQKLGTFKENDKVDVIEKIGDWYKISYNNDYAFVMTKFVNLSSTKNPTTFATTSAAKATNSSAAKATNSSAAKATQTTKTLSTTVSDTPATSSNSKK